MERLDLNPSRKVDMNSNVFMVNSKKLKRKPTDREKDSSENSFAPYSKKEFIDDLVRKRYESYFNTLIKEIKKQNISLPVINTNGNCDCSVDTLRHYTACICVYKLKKYYAEKELEIPKRLKHLFAYYKSETNNYTTEATLSYLVSFIKTLGIENQLPYSYIKHREYLETPFGNMVIVFIKNKCIFYATDNNKAKHMK